MSTAQKIINTLRTEFIQEATSAPKLFKDLAKVEHYIAESYKTRSFIELIQNADDAQSTVFGVHGFNGGLIVANNGRPFTFDDVEALCRSGSSNKSRGNNTIGYRGIGFKSVVNLASRIYVFSGDFAFYFEDKMGSVVSEFSYDFGDGYFGHPSFSGISSLDADNVLFFIRFVYLDADSDGKGEIVKMVVAIWS